MIYAAKPQRGGRNIQANTNNPPQDPPPPTETFIPKLESTEVFIPIENTAPPVPEIIEEGPIIPEIPEIPQKVSWLGAFAQKIKGIFGRK